MKKYKIACISDLHGHFPEIPDCDLLLLGGDYCPYTAGSLFWFNKDFAPWINELSSRMKIIAVSGNHDFIFEKHKASLSKTNWEYLEDSGCEWNGIKFWGSPWQTRFHDWAFNADEPFMKKKWELIPEDTDILLLHGPPYKFGDFSPFGQEHTGSPSLTKRIRKIKPKLVIAGHIHSARGHYKIGKTVFLNCSLVNELYHAVNPLFTLTIDENKKIILDLEKEIE